MQEVLATAPEWVYKAKGQVYRWPNLTDLYVDQPPEIVARVCFCLLQLMVFYTRAWEPESSIVNTCGGLGHATTARRAVMWHHVDCLDANTKRGIVSSTLRLIGQALKEKPMEAFTGKYILPEAATSDNSTASSSGSGPFHTLTNNLKAQLVQAVHRGALPWPKAFENYDAAWRQYDGEVWEVLMNQSKEWLPDSISMFLIWEDIWVIEVYVSPGTKDAAETGLKMIRLDPWLIRPAHLGDLRFHISFFLSGMIPAIKGPIFLNISIARVSQTNLTPLPHLIPEVVFHKMSLVCLRLLVTKPQMLWTVFPGLHWLGGHLVSWLGHEERPSQCLVREVDQVELDK